MKYYQILFYKRKRDQMSSAIYYREFPSFEDLIEWCKSLQNDCGYYRYKHHSISQEKYLKKAFA